MLGQFAAGETDFEVEAVTVREALQAVMSRHVLVGQHILTESGGVREHLHVFLNEEDVRNALDTAVVEGDEVYVLQAMSGGA